MLALAQTETEALSTLMGTVSADAESGKGAEGGGGAPINVIDNRRGDPYAFGGSGGMLNMMMGRPMMPAGYSPLMA